MSLSSAIFLVIAITGLYVTNAVEDPQVPPNLHANSLDLSSSDIFIPKSKWSGKSNQHPQKLQHPSDLVIIAHTATKFCSTFEECSKLVIAMQNYHLSLGLPDIAYNFVIGGDGNIYEGRGWDVVNSQRNNSISVSFIGNYLYDKLTEDMVETLQELLIEGVEIGKLDENYKIVCHNQTKATLSPGVNVYKIVKTLEHFQPGRII